MGTSETATVELLPPPAMTPAAPTRDWLAYGDAMRVLGVFAVILVHTCDMIMFSGQVTPTEWWVANLIDATGRWAVPVFIMLSGALLLHPSREQTAGQFYRRRLARLGIPILFWSPVFMLLAIYYMRWGSAAWNAPNSVWRDLLAGKPYVHLHFVFRLFGLYAITPLLRVYVRHAPLNLRAMMAALMIALGIGNWATTPFLIVTVPDGRMLGFEPTAFTSLWPFLGFYLAGDVLRHVRVTRRMFRAAVAGLVVCSLGMAIGTGLIAREPYTHLRAFPAFDVMLYDFLSPFRVVMSLCAWFVLAHLFGRPPRESRMQRAFAWLAPLTLGIYLVHPLFREVLYHEGWFGAFTRPSVWVTIPLVTLIVCVASTSLTAGLRAVPGVRRIIG